MGRLIGGIVLGYVVMVAFVLATFSLMYMILGAKGTFQPGSWAPSAIWAIMSVLLGLVGAILGGAACAAVARQKNAAKILAVIVLVLGFAFVIPMVTGSGETPTGPRPDEVAMTEAMQNAQQPLWTALINPVVGALGVLIGGGMLAKREEPQEA